MKIVFPDHIELDPAAMAEFIKLGVQMYDDLPTDELVITERVRNAEIITCNWMPVTRTLIDAAPNLRYIISSNAGYDGIDHEYAARKGIKVLNCPTQNSEAVAEHALTLMLAVSHRVVEAAESLRANTWIGPDLAGGEVSHKKLGLIGYGRVGKLIEQKVSGLRMHVRHVNSTSSEKELNALLRESDIVCLCLSLNAKTRRFINRQKLGFMQPHAILVNVARGGVVDQAALLEALKQGKLGGAGLDVFEREPPSGELPPELLELAQLPNVVATPHIAYNTRETVTRLGEELMQNIQACINGRPINVVN